MSVIKLSNNKLSIGIIGAGPAGSMAAYELAQAGHHSVYMIERKKEVERKVCGEYLCPKGVELIEGLGLDKELFNGFYPLHGMVLVSPKNDVVPSYFPQPNRHEKGLSLNRQLFDQRLLNLALSAGAHLLKDKTVTGVKKLKTNKWEVTANENSYEFDFLIAADGRQSKVAHLLGHIKTIDTNRAAIHCYLPRKSERGNRLGEMHIFQDGSYCGLDPINDDEVNFSIVCDSKLLKSKDAKEIINESILHSPRLSNMFERLSSENNYEIRLVTTLKNKNTFIAGEGLAYIGDAAGFIDPLTGEGIYNALLSSHLLADAIKTSATLDEALNRYKQTKKRLSLQKYVLNNFFQFLIKKPFLVNMTAKFLKSSQERANYFIGIIGNIYDPITGLIKMLKA